MADKIRVNTELLERCAGDLRTTAQGFGGAASILAGLDTGKEWWTKMGRFDSIRLQDEGSSVPSVDAGATVRALTAALRRYDNRMTSLGDKVSQTAAMFDELENSLYSRANNQYAGTEGDIIGAPGAASGVTGGIDPASTGTKAEANKDKNWVETGWWDFIRSFVSDADPTGGLSAVLHTINAAGQGAQGQFDLWGLQKYYCDGFSSVAQWVKFSKDLFSNKTVTAVKTLAEEAKGTFFDELASPVTIFFSGVSTGLDNAKQYHDGEITGDRAVVEWAAEWGLDVAKTAGIATGGAALGAAIAGTAMAATPVGWAIAGTAVVSGVYCAVDWFWKENVGGGKGIIETVGDYVGERYDNAKENLLRTGAAICDGVSAVWTGLFG